MMIVLSWCGNVCVCSHLLHSKTLRAASRYVTPAELKELFATAEEKDIKITPWFRLICNEFLFKWWDKLDCLKTCVDADTIHRL